MDPALAQNILLIAATLAVVAVGIAIIHYARRAARGAEATEDDLRAQFQAAYEAGEMDSAEFRRVCESLERQPAQAPRIKTTGLEETLCDPAAPPRAEPEGPATESTSV